MVKLQNIAKQLGNEVKHLGDGLQEEHERERERASCLQYYSKHTRSLQKFGKKITETSNELQALEKEISKCFLTRTEAFNEGGFAKEEDLSKHRKSA